MKTLLDRTVTVMLLVVAGIIIWERIATDVTVGAGNYVTDWDEVLDYSRPLYVGAEGHDSRVTLVEFIDLQCPFCARAHATLDSLTTDYPEDIDVRVVHSPLQGIHPEALSAAIASECAAEQGRFASMVDELLERQEGMASLDWSEVAFAAGVADVNAFDACMTLPADSFPLLVGGIAMAQRFNVNATPTFWFNGEDVPYTSLRRQAHEVLGDAQQR